MKIKRGDIVFLKNKDQLLASGHIQGGKRPLLIVSNDVGNKHSHLVIAVPMTTNTKRLNFPTHVLINESSMVLCEQIFTFNQDHIDRIADHVDAKRMKMVDKCLAVSLGMMV